MYVCVSLSLYIYTYIYIYIYLYAQDSRPDTRGVDPRHEQDRRSTAVLHNKIPPHKIFARVWVAQEPICS